PSHRPAGCRAGSFSAATAIPAIFTLSLHDALPISVAMTTLMATFTLVLIFYLNFKYGYSWAPDNAQLQREVRERDYFFIASFALDRKSTRLNSSHVAISYAVFCLKKKKAIISRERT